MAQKKFSNIQAIYKSLYSRGLYRDVYNNWTGLGFVYLLILIAVLLIPVSFKIGHTLNNIVGDSEIDSKHNIPISLVQLIEQFPDMKYKNGEISLDVPQPYVISNPDTGTNLVIFDTTGTVKDPADQNSIMLITKRTVMVRENDKIVQRFSIKELLKLLKVEDNKEIVINHLNVMDWVRQGLEKIWTVPFTFYFWQMLQFFATFSLRALVFAGIGYFVSRLLNVDVAFRTLIRIASVASTLVIISEMASMALGWSIFSNREFVYMTMHTLYMYFALESLKKSEENPDGL